MLFSSLMCISMTNADKPLSKNTNISPSEFEGNAYISLPIIEEPEVRVYTCNNKLFFERVGALKIERILLGNTTLCDQQENNGITDCDCFFESNSLQSGPYTLVIEYVEAIDYNIPINPTLIPVTQTITVSADPCECTDENDIYYDWQNNYPEKVGYSGNYTYFEVDDNNQSLVIDYNFNNNNDTTNNGVEIKGDRLRFSVDGANGDYRSELRVGDFPIEYSLGKRHVLNWSYYFPKSDIPSEYSYVFPNEPFIIYQNKTKDPNGVGISPVFSLTIVDSTQDDYPNLIPTTAGEIQVVNQAIDDGNFKQRINTGIVPEAGNELEIMLAVRYERDCPSSNSLDIILTLFEYENGPVIKSFKYTGDASILAGSSQAIGVDQPWGGNHKLGLYSFRWNGPKPESCDNCIDRLELEMGPFTINEYCIFDAYSPYLTGNNGSEGCNGPWIDTDGDEICDYADVCEGGDDYVDSDGDGIPDACDASNPSLTDARLAIENVFLQGALNNSPDAFMRDDLRAQSLIPNLEPYSEMANYIHIGGGGEQAAPSVFAITGNNAIVDWVFIEINDINNNVVATRSALLQRDGNIVDTNGVSPVAFTGLADGDYRVTIRHRNHINATTQNTLTFTSGTTSQVDFSMEAIVGTFPMVEANGQMALWACNAAATGQVAFQGPGNIPNGVFFEVLSAPSNNANNVSYIYNSVYSNWDLDMNGEVIYQGGNSDVNFVFFTILLHPGNTGQNINYIIEEQAP